MTTHETTGKHLLNHKIYYKALSIDELLFSHAHTHSGTGTRKQDEILKPRSLTQGPLTVIIMHFYINCPDSNAHTLPIRLLFHWSKLVSQKKGFFLSQRNLQRPQNNLGIFEICFKKLLLK